MEFESIVEAVAFHAKTSPEKLALIEAETDRRCTYAQFWSYACGFAGYLRQIGLKKGERVMVRVGGLLETFVAQLGIYLAGGVYCPLERHIKAQKIADMSKYFDSKLLISTENLLFNGKWIDLNTVCRHHAEKEADMPTIFPGGYDLAAIIFTTGTTGKAKGVMLSFQALVASGKAWGEAFGITENTVYLFMQPLDRVGGVRSPAAAFLAGGTVVHYGEIVFIGGYFQAIKKYGATVLHINFSGATILLKGAPTAFGDYAEQLDTIFVGGGVLPESFKNQLRKLLPKTRLFTLYGATEASPIAYFEFSRYPNKPFCAGIISPFVKVEFLDEDGKLMYNVSKDNIGIIACESETAMLGYWNDPELTEKTLCGKRLIMTDMGYIGDDGFLYIVGRRDDVIVSGGYKIAPYEIEEIARQLPGIEDCVCIPIEDVTLGYVPKLFVKIEDGVNLSEKEIYRYLSLNLETFKLPRAIQQINAIPRVGETRKIDRRSLKEYGKNN